MALEELRKLKQDIEAARAEGYSDEEIRETFMTKKPIKEETEKTSPINLKVDFSGVKEVDLPNVESIFPVKEMEGFFGKTLRPLVTLGREIFGKLSDLYDESVNFKEQSLESLREFKDTLFRVEVVNQNDELIAEKIENVAKQIAGKVLTVKIKDQEKLEFPVVQKVEVINEPKPITIPKEMRISNSEPEDAIPVVLTTKDKKDFYDAIMEVVASGGAGTVMYRDDTPFKVGTTRVVAIGCVYDDTSPDSVDENDIGMPRMSANRNQYMQIRDAAGNERGVNVNASGELQVASNSPITGIADGSKSVTTAGTAVALAASTTCKEVTVMANEQNTGIIVIGGSTVVAAQGTRRGIPLLPLTPMTIKITNLNLIYIDSTVSGEGVTFTYFT